jgi:hypothetical protein
MTCRALFLGLTLNFVVLLTGCVSHHNGLPTAAENQNLDNEATGIAQKFKDLLIARCPTGYYMGNPNNAPDRPGQPTPAPDPPVAIQSVVATAVRNGRLSSEDRFHGYQWEGMVEFTYDNGQQPSLEWSIYKRGGNWYLKLMDQRFPEPDVPVKELQSVRDCPAIKE